jgi:DNA-binding response OmpR family regulator
LEKSGLLEGTETLLVVDDEQLILDLLQRALAKRGYQVLTAASVPDALTLYAQNREQIALVITDLAMPVADGAALALELRQMNPDLPVLVSTGITAEAEIAPLKKAGVWGVVRKPYQIQELLATIRALLDGG